MLLTLKLSPRNLVIKRGMFVMKVEIPENREMTKISDIIKFIGINLVRDLRLNVKVFIG